MMTAGSPIAIAILNNRQIEIDGIHYRLAGEQDIYIIGVARYGIQLPWLLSRGGVDLLLADVTTPTAPDNTAPHPIFQQLPNLRRDHPALKVALVAARGEPGDARRARREGACGFLLKSDRAAWTDLASVVRRLASGDRYVSSSPGALWAGEDHKRANLTPRQFDLLSLLADHPDMTTYEAALRLGVAHSTARNLLSHAYARLGVSTRAAAIVRLRGDAGQS